MEIQKTTSLMQNKALTAPKKQVASDATEVKDQVTLGDKIKDVAREVIEFPLGVAGAITGGVTNIIPGAFEGGPASVNHGRTNAGFEIGHTVQDVALGIVGGLLLNAIIPGGGVVAALIGGGAGLAAALTRLGLYHATDTDDTMKKEVCKTVERYLSDNKINKDDDVQNGIRDLIEGTGVGAVKGGIEGTKTGYYEGKGVTAGIMEGAKGVKDVILGNYPKAEEEKEKMTIGKAIGKVIKAPIALASGIVGAVSTLPTGLIHGTKAGMELAEGEKLDSYDLRKTAKSVNLWTKIGSVGLGAAAGAMLLGGPIGIAVGLAGGLISAAIASKLQKKGGADKEIGRGILNAVNYAHNDNKETDSKAYNTYRDVIESAAVGTAASLKEGFKVGYLGGEAAQEGVFEVVKELVHKSSNSSSPVAGSEPTYEEKEKMDASYPFGIKKPEQAPVETTPVETPQTTETTQQEEVKPQEAGEPHKKSAIRKGIEAVGGSIVGGLSTLLHIGAGGIEGAAEGVRDRKLADKDANYRHAKTGLFTFANLAALTAIAGGAACLLGAGPLVIALAAGGGLIAGGALRGFEGSEKTEKLVEKIDLNVDKAIKDNVSDSKSKVAGQNLTEGTIVGMKAAGKHSWDIGYEGGKNATGFVIDVGRGVAGGIVELGKDVIGFGPKKEVKNDGN
jgi:hypothetical protein